ncbi:hypothetical protein MKX07_003225 [Trichoderma sp. CBMAI-0711]|nr:hypothetical protein MKX07_003225 [Trichoderma sp. CBMAI-0711]
MEHIDALTADNQQPADTQDNDERSSSSSSSSEPTSKKPTIPEPPTEAPPKLKTSERRRIQNRQAQKTYREKQKRRLQALESLAKSKTLAKDAPASGTPIGQDMAGILAADSPIMVGLSGVMQPQELGPAAGLGVGSLVGCGTTFNATALSYQTGAPAPMYRYTPNLDFQPADTTLNSGRSFREDLFSASNPLVAQSGSIAFSPGGDLDSPSLQQVPPSHHIVQDGQSAERDDTDSLLAQFLLQDDAALSTSLLANIRNNKITLKDVLRKVQLPDLHTNTIRVTQMSFVAAVLHNATMLGVTATEMFEYESESPFCTPQKTPDTSTDGLAFTEIKDDLKPTQNQLTQRHHPYIDALPFRAFRERLIALMYAEPPIINRDELCHDLQSDGVICWGSFAGAGTGHSGAPWDIRSWEVRPWFLKKYWMITEGAQGEMYQQARWWCELRGEDVPTLW